MTTVPCIYPVYEEGLTLREGWDEWRTSDDCTHAYCQEVEGYRLSRPARLSYLRCDECGDLLEPDGSCDIHGLLDLNLEGQPEFNGAFDKW